MTYDIKCKHCNRFLATVDTSVAITLKCSNSSCKKLDTYKVSFLSEQLCQPHEYTPGNRRQDFKLEEEIETLKNQIVDLESQLVDMDGRTKEAKELKTKLNEAEQYAKSLEGIIDGQG